MVRNIHKIDGAPSSQGDKMTPKFLKMCLILVVLILASLACGQSSGNTDNTNTGGGETPPTTAPPDIPAPTATPVPAVELGEVYRSEDGGYAFAQVPGWVTEEFFGFASHAPEGANPDTDPLIALIGGLEEEDTDLDTAFNAFLTEFTTDATGSVVSGEPFNTMVGSIPARGVELTGTNEDGTPVAGRLVVALVNPRQTLIALGAAQPEMWTQEISALFDAVVGSITFFEPAFDPNSLGNTGDSDTPPTDMIEIREWAIAAVASSEYGSSDWTATSAVGEPDLYPECADDGRAWASATGGGQDWLEVYFATPVLPTEINIYETHSPDQVVNVEVLGVDNVYYSVYTAEPYVALDCPMILSVPVNLDVEVTGVRISLNQTVLPWTEIDAVELVGLSGGEVIAQPTPIPVVGEIPEGFLWRLGGESGIDDEQYAALGGMDVDTNGFLYVSDNIHGLWIYDAAGTFFQKIDHNEFNNPNDVAVSSQGGGYIVATTWGNNSVFVMDFNGNILTQFGSEGNGPGQFGGFSPESVAIDIHNKIYVLDDNEDSAGEDWMRIQVFDINGTYQYEWTVEDDFFSATAIEYWAGPTPADDRLYVLGFIGGYIIEYDLLGNRIREIGADALDFTGPQDLALDKAGNIYVTTWTPDGVMKLDHDGNLIASWGVEAADGDNPWMEGSFYQAGGVAVAPDGSQVYANDWSGDFAYVTAFQFK
jgi:hypothetical protein